MYLFIYILALYVFRAHRARNQERQIVSIQPLVAVTLFRWSCRLQVCKPEVVLTRFVSPDNEHDVLGICRELKYK